MKSTGEIWRVVPSVPALMVSSDGRMMVVPYEGDVPRGKGTRQYGGQPHFGVWEKTQGRFIYHFRGRTYRIARLVCEAFHGPAPKGKNVVMHIDENAANNRPDNLAWGTQKENLNAPGFIDYCKSRTGEKSPIAKSRAKRGAG